jgi:hypothetical protein
VAEHDHPAAATRSTAHRHAHPGVSSRPTTPETSETSDHVRDIRPRPRHPTTSETSDHVRDNRLDSTLNSAKEWLIRNNTVVMAVLILVFGVNLIGDGITIVFR